MSAERELVAAVLESFARADWSSAAAGAGISVEELAAAREAFVAAGTAALASVPRADRWVQYSLAGPADDAHLQRLLTHEAGARLLTWLRAEPGRGFFYLHKPPGLRLRFTGVSPDCAAALATELDALVRDGTVASWSPGPYDAEVMQFGGLAGLELTHRFFMLESAAVLTYHRLRAAGRARLDAELFSLIAIDRLLRALTDRWERWDVWCKMELTGRLGEGAPTGAEPGAARVAAVLLGHQPRLLGAASDSERELFARYDAGVQRLAPDILDAVDRCTLAWGLREILPFWIVHHWNRMQFALETQQRLAALMVAALSPKGR